MNLTYAHWAGPCTELAEDSSGYRFDHLKVDNSHHAGDWGYWRSLRRHYERDGEQALSECDTLEAVLAFALGDSHRNSCLAHALLDRFGDLAAVCGASPHLVGEALRLPHRQTYRVTALLRIMHATTVKVMRREVVDRPMIGSYDAVIRYCQALMADHREDQFRILFLNKKNVLIADELHGRGTIDHVPLYPREVARRALELGASAIIMVHNHPSGDPSPSAADIEMTRKVVDALQLFDMVVHDHIIVGTGRHLSFRSQNLI
ncbi:MAG: DNA repair protein RadC [Geminicoccaceae bacterium]